MDRTSGLSDDLILKILSFVPSKVAVATSLLSKRWRSLWKHVPKLCYFDPSIDSEFWRASRFVEKFLLLHNKAPVLDTLQLKVSRFCPPTDIETWVSIAVSRGVRNLVFYQHRPCNTALSLPRSLFTCETLVTLKLHQANVVDVPLTICFRSLKRLYLTSVGFSSDKIFVRLLTGCPVLEGLVMAQCSYVTMTTFTIAVPSLKNLLVVNLNSLSKVPGDDFGLVIEAPSLKSLVIVSRLYWVCSLVKMPKLVFARIKIPHGDSRKLLGCLTSAKNLSLCVKQAVDSYPISVFCQLVSLKLCTCSSDWFRLILKHTPKLRVLRFQHPEILLPSLANIRRYCSSYGDVQSQWEQPSSVPQCLVSSLETVEWIDYEGTKAEKKVVMYLLENSRQLKTVVIRALNSNTLEKRHKMLQELSSTQRSSTKCRLSFI
ncbi:unnamed protein product [Thlaspi arvense]|uniref:FBD domain-containing protein n=1 Tax=Thlaspi arvense TaxID=13288 RepID=A0AAU9SME6_THLAR|nr:unnamed protein product [Thlaspi arvense]